MSLVGEQCPGTVRLFCEGVHLTGLHWKYNNGMNVVTVIIFLGDETSLLNRTISLQSPFVSVQLLNLMSHDWIHANFYSVLTVDLLQLQKRKT